MDEKFIATRLARLRTIKGVSARDMSLTMGQANNYISNIENGKSSPSIQGLLYACEYLGIHPRDFFDEDNPQPELIQGIVEDLKCLDETALTHLAGVVKEMKTKKK